jgi:hypothetical protein
MSFKRLEADDFLVSSDAISATAWTTNSPTLTAFYTSSVQANDSSGDYYLNVYSTTATSSIQFAIAYGNEAGSGSANYNNAVNGKSPTGTIFGQWQDLVIGDENTNFIFGTITSSQFFALPIERQCYKESLFLGSLTLNLTGSSGSIQLTDNSNYVSSVQFCEAGRIFQLITGSAGSRATFEDPEEYDEWEIYNITLNGIDASELLENQIEDDNEEFNGADAEDIPDAEGIFDLYSIHNTDSQVEPSILT